MIVHQQTHHVPRSILVDPSDVSGFSALQRSSSGQVYYTSALQRDVHFSCPHERVHLFNELNLPPMTSEQDPKRSLLYVPNTKNFCSPEDKLAVINKDTETNGNPIRFCTESLESMFKAGLSRAFTDTEKKEVDLAVVLTARNSLPQVVSSSLLFRWASLTKLHKSTIILVLLLEETPAHF